jgi:dTDP-4-dehydrorhamnose reductase
MKIMLLGANGQLGSAFRDLAKTEAFPIGWTLVTGDRETFDLSHPEALRRALDSCLESPGGERPDLIVNAAAYTAVDRAESEAELCQRVNAESPRMIADFCKRAGIPLLHYSSDYVYSGAGIEPHVETEPHAPLNEYGRSKAAGDEAVLKSGADALIFRTSWVYSHTGKNFVKTMLRLAQQSAMSLAATPAPGKPAQLRIVADQIGAPTYAPDLARYSLEALMRALERKTEGRPFPTGVYHLANSGHTSWAGFARAILPQTTIQEIPSTDYPTPARRPLNSRLNLEKFERTFGVKPRPWQEAVRDCLDAIQTHKKMEPAHGSE